MLTHGLDMTTMDPGRVCNVIYHMVVQHASEEERRNLDAQLNMPLKGETVDEIEDGPWSKKAMADSFKAAMNAT